MNSGESNNYKIDSYTRRFYAGQRLIWYVKRMFYSFF
jgi:hypothetical protein